MAVAWASDGPEDPAEVVRHHVSEEDAHVHCYLFVLEHNFSNTWQVLQGSHWSYDPVMVPCLCVSTARADSLSCARVLVVLVMLYV